MKYRVIATGQELYLNEVQQMFPNTSFPEQLTEEICTDFGLEIIPFVPTYQQLRAAEYPPMADYVDGIVKGDSAQVQTYIDACLAVKAKYPKPEA